MNQNQIVCAGCGVAHNSSADADFLQLNAPKRRSVPEEWLATQPARPPQFTTEAPVLHFCSTQCLSGFIADDRNYGRIAWLETEKLPPTPEDLVGLEERYRARALTDSDADRNEYREYWLPRLEALYHWERAHEGRLGCDLRECITPEEVEAERIRYNIPTGRQFAMLTPVRPGPGLCFSSWSQGEGNPRGDHAFCCVACAIRFCEQFPFDAKDHWVNKGIRCTHCDGVRNEDHGCHGGYTVCGKHFCSAQCALTHVKGNPLFLTGWMSREEVLASDRKARRPERVHNGCAHCRTENDSARFVLLDSVYESTLDDEYPAMACSVACVVGLFEIEDASRAP
ncbi:MAG: hypothetical protein RL141_501 [Candidatus Parcubacteria bacterium]|jgi:hypothetical protein